MLLLSYSGPGCCNATMFKLCGEVRGWVAAASGERCSTAPPRGPNRPHWGVTPQGSQEAYYSVRALVSRWVWSRIVLFRISGEQLMNTLQGLCVARRPPGSLRGASSARQGFHKSKCKRAICRRSRSV
jgi:hypothetical protein